MRFALNRKSPLPIHVQLQAQLTHLIQSGHWRPGTQLPTVRQLARVLRINRNTAAKVFGELERDGYLSCEPGRGTFVSPRRAGAKTDGLRELWATADEAARRARRLGVAPAEFAAGLYARAVSGRSTRPPTAPVLFLECERSRLRRLSRQLAEALPARVDALLTQGLRRRLRRSPASLRRYGAAATTLFHAHEVRTLLAKTDVEVIGLLARPSPATLARLAALPARTRVAVTEHTKRALLTAGLTHLRLVPLAGRGRVGLRRAVKRASVVVCSSRLARQLRATLAKGIEIVVDDRELDRAGIELLRRRLWQRAHAWRS